MSFSVNYLAVIVATIAAGALSALWYSVLVAGPVAALRRGDPTIARRDPGPPLIALSIVANLVAAWGMAVVIESTGGPTIAHGLLVAAFAWLAFAMPPLTVIHTFGFRRPGFVVLDGGAWLLTFLASGAIIGAFG